MALFDFLGKKKAPEAITPIPPSENNPVTVVPVQNIEEIANIMISGVASTVTSPKEALKFAEYYNSINQISNSVANLSCNFYDNDVKLTETEYNQVFLWRKMMAPGISSPKMIKAWVTNYLKGGNGYLICDRDKDLTIKKYIHKEYHKMFPFIFEGEPWYFDIDTKKVYNWYNVLHLADIINDELVGVTKVKHYSQALGKSKAANEFYNKYFNAGLFLSGQLNYPAAAIIDEKDIPGLEERMRNNFGGVSKSGKVLVTTQGATLNQFKTDIPLSDTEWLKNEEITAKNVREAFGRPEDMSTEGGRTEYYENAVLPVLRQIEAEVNTKVVEVYNQQNIRFKFEQESLLRADVKTKADVIEKYLRNSIYTINEARALLNLPPIEGGDKPMVMANNMVPLEQLEEFINSKIK